MSAVARKKPGRQPTAQGKKPGRTTAEWVSLGLSLAIVATMAGLVIYAEVTRSHAPAIIDIQPQTEAVREANGSYYLPVEISNIGGETVEALDIALTLAGADAAETAQVAVAFLAAGETVRTVAVFGQDPAEGELAVTFSFLEP